MTPGGCISFKRERHTQRRNQNKSMPSSCQEPSGLGSRISHRFVKMVAGAQSMLKIMAARPFRRKQAPARRLSAKITSKGSSCTCNITVQGKHIVETDVRFGGDISHTRTSDSVLIPTAEQKGVISLEVAGCGFEDLQIEDAVGRGSHGTVYRASLCSSRVAVKVDRCEAAQTSRFSSAKSSQAPELELLKGMSHPNLVEIFDVREVYGDQCIGEEDYFDDAVSFDSDMMTSPCYINKNSIWSENYGISETWVIMEYCNQGSLWDAIRRGDFKLKKEQSSMKDHRRIIEVGLQIARAMGYLHNHGIIHGDLKAQNVMLQSSERAPKQVVAKVGDFGMCRRLKVDRLDMTTFSWGTVDHMAPETLQDGKLHCATDVFSFGILLMEMITGSQPYMGMTTPAVIMAVVRGMRPKIPSTCPLSLVSLISDCWHQDWRKRPTFRTIVHRLLAMRMKP